jgi:hypothetical protein
MIADLQRAGRKVPALLSALAHESAELVKWGADQGFDEKQCRAAFWLVTRTCPPMPMPETFVAIRKMMMLNRAGLLANPIPKH